MPIRWTERRHFDVPTHQVRTPGDRVSGRMSWVGTGRYGTGVGFTSVDRVAQSRTSTGGSTGEPERHPSSFEEAAGPAACGLSGVDDRNGICDVGRRSRLRPQSPALRENDRILTPKRVSHTLFERRDPLLRHHVGHSQMEES
jgi:hypothetical protein